MTEANRMAGTPRNAKRRLRLMLWSGLLIVLGAMILPLGGYVWTAVVQAQESAQTAADDATNPRAEYWRGVREGVKGYTAVSGQEMNVLIQSGGEVWREIRMGPVIAWGAWGLIAILVAIVVFHLVFGTVRLESRSGRKILRWPLFDRIVHWWVAVLFIILGITGLSLLFGRSALIPLLGKEGFAAYAAVAKPVHDYLSPLFIIGLVVMLLMWLGQNFPNQYDMEWLRKGGGYLGKSHPPAGFVNAGEKIWFWLLFIFGIALIASGFYLLFPNFGWERSTMQWATIIHGVSGLVLTGFVFGHIYLGTLGNEGSFEGMIGGEVDENWAKQHHNQWYEEVKKGGAAAAPARTPESSAAVPT